MQTPHDRFFRHIFSNPEHTAGELRTKLPTTLAARIDWATLTLVPGTFVDPDLAEQRTDLLFSAQLAGRDVLLYFVFEHQSSVDPFMPLRLLSYLVRIWEDHRRKNPEARRLPPIVPLVLHHSEAGWTEAVAFEALLDLPDELVEVLRPHLPGFTFLLDDLSSARDDELRARVMTALGRLALWSLKNGRSGRDLVDELSRWSEVLLEVVQAPNGVAALAAVLTYLLEVGSMAPERLRALSRTLGPKGEEAYMTGAQLLREEGRREGEAKGKAEGLREGEAKGLREGEAKGLREGEARGKAEGLRTAVLDLCEAFGLEPTGDQRTQLEAMGVSELEALRAALKQTRRWPD